MLVSLREITAATVREVTRLSVGPDQQRFVAANAISLSEALFSEEAWYRAIYAGASPAGFVMLYDESLRVTPPRAPKIGLWRFMIDARFQGRGIGTAALQHVIAHVRDKGLFSSLATSYVPGPGSPEAFYIRAGFQHTGEIDDGEIVLELPMLSNAP
jgi:diamine N-acetyltransferase